jgi:hypothetical protein
MGEGEEDEWIHGCRVWSETAKDEEQIFEGKSVNYYYYYYYHHHFIL